MTQRLGRALLVLTVFAAPATAEAAFITFGSSTQNVVEGPTTYTFMAGTPITPDIYTTATAIAEVTVTPGADGTGSVSVSSIYPSYLSGYGTLGGVPTNLGVDLGTTTCTATGGVSTVCSFALITNTFSPTFFDGLELMLTYEQTGRASIAKWSTTVTLTTASAPEPASLLLFAVGLLGAGARLWRQTRG